MTPNGLTWTASASAVMSGWTEDNGDTLLTGVVVDQAALHGLLRKVRDVGMPLVSVSPATASLEPGPRRPTLRP
jgi:hypothetical protein